MKTGKKIGKKSVKSGSKKLLRPSPKASAKAPTRALAQALTPASAKASTPALAQAPTQAAAASSEATQHRNQKRLLERARALQSVLERTQARANVAFDDLPSEENERATTIESAGAEGVVSENIHRVWVQVQEALSRLENGTYGFCVNCDEEIPSKRLEILPEASLCISCQSENERWGRNGIFASAS